GGAAAEAGGRRRGLAALPLRPAPPRDGRAGAAPRLGSAEREGGRLHAQRVALPDDRADRSGALPEIPQAGPGRGAAALRRLPAARRDHRSPDRGVGGGAEPGPRRGGEVLKTIRGDAWI